MPLLGDRLIGVKPGIIDPAWRVKYLDYISRQDTISYNRKALSVWFNGGINMLTYNDFDRTVSQYSLPDHWVLIPQSSRNVLEQTKFYIPEITGNVRYISSSGTEIFLLDYTRKRIYRYDLNGNYETYFQLPDSYTYGSTVLNFTEYYAYRGLYHTGGVTGSLYVTVRSADLKIYVLKITDVNMGSTLNIESIKDTGETDSYVSVIGYEGGFFSSDGTKFYLEYGPGYPQKIIQHTLSTPWDVESSTSRVSKNIASSTTSNVQFFIGDSGTKLYYVPNESILQSGTSSVVYVETMSEAWNVETLTGLQTYTSISEFKLDRIMDIYVREYGGGNFLVHTIGSDQGIYEWHNYYSRRKLIPLNIGYLTSLWFSSDGNKVYLLTSEKQVREYTMSTPWNIETIDTETYVAFSISFVSYTAKTRGICFSDNGHRLFTISADNVVTSNYLSTAWDLSTAYPVTYVILTHNSELGAVESLSVSPEGTWLNLIRRDGYVLEYRFTSPFDFKTINYVQYKSIRSYVSLEDLNGMYIYEDGLKMKITSGGNRTTHYIFSL